MRLQGGTATLQPRLVYRSRRLCPVDRQQPGGNGPALFLNPADDSAFVGEVERSMEDGIEEAADLELRLRRSYPNAVVRPRGLANEPFVVWYVYRDGHWVASG
jgi:hypothetical protein